MTIVEGFGDEVTLFFSFLVLIIVLIITWKSTAVSQIRSSPRENRTSFVHNVNTDETNENDDLNTENVPDTSPGDLQVSPNSEYEVNVSASTSGTQSNETSSEANSTTSSGCPESLDDTNLRQRRTESITACNPSHTTSRIDEINSVISSNFPQPIDDIGPRQRRTDASKSSDESHSTSHADEINIRLKYLNDRQRLVVGKSDEKLIEFKRREFAQDLSDNKRVLLIYNGELLKRDNLTLKDHGLVNNCFLHCHITGVEPNQSSQGQRVTENFNSHEELDLSHLMIPLFGFMLATGWYFRIQFRHLFNPVSTFALIAITFLFVIAIILVYNPMNNLPPPIAGHV